MASIKLDIPDDKILLLLEFVKEIRFVQGIEVIRDDDTTATEEFLDGLKASYKEAKDHLAGKIKLQTMDNFLNELRDIPHQ